MLRLCGILIIYVQSLLFLRYAETMHTQMANVIEWRQQLLLDPDRLLTGEFCQRVTSGKTGAACTAGLYQREDGQWRESCAVDHTRQIHTARYWLLTMECRVTFLFFSQRVLHFQQRVLR